MKRSRKKEKIEDQTILKNLSDVEPATAPWDDDADEVVVEEKEDEEVEVVSSTSTDEAEIEDTPVETTKSLDDDTSEVLQSTEWLDLAQSLDTTRKDVDGKSKLTRFFERSAREEPKNKKSKLSEDKSDDTNELFTKASKKIKRVLIYEGDRFSVIKVKGGTVVSVATLPPFETALDAATALAKRAGRWKRSSVVVWSTEGLSIRPTSEHQHIDNVHRKAQELWAADLISDIFNDQTVGCSTGSVALAIKGEQETHLQKIRAKTDQVVLADICVGSEDGIWLRVGYRIISATLVRNGIIAGVMRMEKLGLTNLEEALEKADVLAHDGEKEISDFIIEISDWTGRAISNWLSLTTVSHIWLYGPGAQVRGLSSKLNSDTGCRVLPPKLDKLKVGKTITDDSLLPTVYQALLAPRMIIPSEIVARQHQVKRRKMLLGIFSYLAVIGILGFESWRQGDALDTKVKVIQTELSTREVESALIQDQIAVSDATEVQAQILRDMRLPITLDPVEEGGERLLIEAAPPALCNTNWQSIMDIQIKELQETGFSWGVTGTETAIIQFPMYEIPFTDEWVSEVESIVQRIRVEAGGDEYVQEATPDFQIDDSSWYLTLSSDDEEEILLNEEEDSAFPSARSLLQIPITCGTPESGGDQ